MERIKWRRIIDDGNPPTNGTYLLLVGIRGKGIPSTQLGVVTARLVKGAWDIPKSWIPMSWSKQVDQQDRFRDFRDILKTQFAKVLP